MMENQSTDSSGEVVTLVLRDHRVEANKEKLARYSLYFASLFSENFKDHNQTEFTINYDLSLTTLKNFVHWINNEGDHTRVVHSPKYLVVVRASLEKFLTGHYTELLELLELSVVFMAEKLTDNIIEIIICMRLPPDKLLEIWLLAENLGLKVLRNVALAVCLDRFEELPVSLLVELPIDNFFKLVLNINVKSTPARLLVIREEWKKHNDIPKDLPDSYSQFLNSDADSLRTILEKRRPRYVQCVAGKKLTKSLGIYSWNGKSLHELTEMTDSQMHTAFVDNGKEIIGRQVVGRGFGIYLIGGEQGLGSGRFNTALWRYCVFSKKWYIESLLPRPRRHMAAVFLDNKLYLFGGVGRHRLKLTSVDVFNIHTGIWSKAADVPEEFTEVPASCVINNKFIYYKSFYYVYDPISDTWSTLGFEKKSCSVSEYCNLDAMLDDKGEPQVPVRSIVGHRNQACTTDPPVAYVTDVNPNIKRTYLHESIFLLSEGDVWTSTIHEWQYEDGPSVFDQQIINWPYLIGFAYSDGRVTIEVGELRDNDSKQPTEDTNRLYQETYRRLRTYSKELNGVATSCFKLRQGCFNLIDPTSLHVLIPLPKQESINV